MVLSDSAFLVGDGEDLCAHVLCCRVKCGWLDCTVIRYAWVFSDGLFADDDDMAFGIELGDVQCFDFFDSDAFGQFVDFFLRVYAFHGRPVAAVFEEVLGPVDEVGEFGKGAAGDDVGAAVGGGFYAAADDADVF